MWRLKCSRIISKWISNYNGGKVDNRRVRGDGERWRNSQQKYWKLFEREGDTARLEEIVDVEKPRAELPPILSAMLRKSIAKNALLTICQVDWSKEEDAVPMTIWEDWFKWRRRIQRGIERRNMENDIYPHGSKNKVKMSLILDFQRGTKIRQGDGKSAICIKGHTKKHIKRALNWTWLRK